MNRHNDLRNEYLAYVKALPKLHAVRKDIEFATLDGNRRKVTADTYNDALAIDRREEMHGGKKLKGWIVTHIASGKKMPCIFTTKQDALNYVKACLDACGDAFILPTPDAETVCVAKEILLCLEKFAAVPTYYADKEETL